MANTSRRQLDSAGNQFMPMNVEGGSWDENFISTKKLVAMGALFFILLFMIMVYADQGTSFGRVAIGICLWLLAAQWVVRYIVFEEKFYYKMYKIMKDHEITTPAIFWDITSIKDSYDGAIMTYSDTKIGILVRLERDTITGKNKDFKETHYDAISDFYRELVQSKYKFVQMNVMQQAGNDPRLDELSKLIHKSDNKNICELMEREIGFIKSISHKTLYESDYILIYTSDLQKVDSIIDDAVECIYKILDGAYIGYRVLTAREIIEFVKEIYGVKYFNYTQATLDMFKLSGTHTGKPFSICEIQYTDGSSQNITNYEINKIYQMTSDVMSGTRRIEDISLQETLKRKEVKNNGVSFEDLSKGFYVDESINQLNKGRPSKRFGKLHGNSQYTNQNNNNDQSEFMDYTEYSDSDIEESEYSQTFKDTNSSRPEIVGDDSYDDVKIDF